MSRWEAVGLFDQFVGAAGQGQMYRDGRAACHGCIKVLAGILSQEAVPAAARVSAASALLDRGWGKAAQSNTGEDDKDVHITIRQIVEGGDKD